MRRVLIACIACLAVVVAVAAASPSPVDSGATTQSGSATDAPVIAAVGDMVCNRGPKEGPDRDIAKYGLCQYKKVSDLVVDGNYDAFLTLGDLQYLRGGLQKFRDFYDPTYGRVKDITYPSPGNHESYTPGFAGYFGYFGKAAHPPRGWYSYNIGDWHMIELNSQLCKNKTWYPRTGMVHHIRFGGCREGDPQYEWLQRDLARHPNSEYPCTLAYFHHPLFKWSYWPLRKSDRIQRPLWRALLAGGADVVLNGHQHNYQRFEPLNTRGELSDKGMAEFIVGTGGDTLQRLATPGHWNYQPKPTGLAAAEGDSYGILQMTLNPDSYDFKFITAEGQPAFEDAGSADCR